VWRAASEEGVVLLLHIGSSSQQVITVPDAPIDRLVTLTPINIVQADAGDEIAKVTPQGRAPLPVQPFSVRPSRTARSPPFAARLPGTTAPCHPRTPAN
jgi:hypothetical protein